MSVHLHTTIPRKTDKILVELAKTHGTKSRVLEKALDTFLRVEKVGSCDECTIKAKMIEQANLKEALDLTALERKTLDGLLEVSLGDRTFDEFIEELQIESLNKVTVIKDSIGWGTPASFKELLFLTEEIQKLTRLFDVVSYNEIDNTIVLRTKVFRKIPEIIAIQLATILEGTKSSFDLRIMGDDIILKMVRNDTFPLKKSGSNSVLSHQFQKRLERIRPALFKNDLSLVGPGFFDWAQKHLNEPVTDLATMIEDVRIVLGVGELPKEPRDFLNAIVSAGLKFNWLRQVKILEESKEVLTITFQAVSPAVAKLAINAFSVMLATRGWKLLGFDIEHANGRIKVEFAGLEDQSLLDKLAELNTYQTIVTQFLDMIPVPRTILNTLASKVLETNRDQFSAVYMVVGEQISNAIKLLARNDRERARRLAEKFVIENINAVKANAEVKFLSKSHFTVVFKRIDPLVMVSQQILIESIFRDLGYEVSATAFQNLLDFNLKQIEKPLLKAISRKAVMNNLVEAMSASNCNEAFSLVKSQIDKIFPEDYPWTIREVGRRLLEMYREVDMKVEIEYFEGGFTLKYETCPYYKLVKSGQKKWLCEFRRKTIEYIIAKVTKEKKGRIKMIKSLLRNEHPCEYAVFLKGFLE
ncbi:MAG: hypothetical protein JSV35_03795 [Candidatus Bathyarchaeota archaeon]|nr:MAG: hypothetical protein JSV35_03795 [Candidatus Bathyarchaeota archaeon]